MRSRGALFKGNPPYPIAPILTLIVALPLLHACTSDREPETKNEEFQVAVPPIVLMGVDGLEWDVIIPMLKKGRLPNFRTLMERGYYGELETFVPTTSPVVWTTVATGKVHQGHGIHHFIRRLPDRGFSLFNNTDRKTKAIWNILSDYDKSVYTIGWWMTYPVEEINGVMVAQTNTKAQLQARKPWKGTLFKGVEGQVHPPDRQNEMITILEEVEEELPDLTRQIFGEFRFPVSLLDQHLWKSCQWAFRADATYLRIALKLADEAPSPDLTLVYLGGPDVVGHHFWRYMQPDIYRHKPTRQQIANFGSVIEDYYAYTDQALGQLLEAYGSNVVIFVISDHGMRPINRNGSFEHAGRRPYSGEHQDAPPGVFFAAGPYIRRSPERKAPQSLTRGDLETVGSVLDITPTILALMRIPLGKDMDGRAITKIFGDEFQIDRQPRAIATHDTPEFLARRGENAPPHPGERERLEQLRSLGYIGD